MARTLPAFLALVLLAPPLSWADVAADEAILKKTGVGSDAASLLRFLKSAVPGEGKVDEVEPIVRLLGSEDFFEREEAIKKVISLGPRALPFLRAVLKEADRELVLRAAECLKIIEGGPGADVHGAVLRLLGERKPEGAASAILEYLPFAPNERLNEEANLALEEVALEGDKPAAPLVAALGDKYPSRRAAAAAILARHAFADHKETLRKLLKDADPVVRSKVGIGLALHKDKDAIPVLIDALATLSPGPAASVESLLHKLANYKGPAGPFASSKAQRDAWAGWWAANAATADLARLTAVPKMLGHTLLVHNNAGRVEEIDTDGKVIWKIDGLQGPIAAQLFADDRFVVLESRLRRMSIRTTKGATIRTIVSSLASDVQALPDGNFLVSARTGLIEYNPAGALVRRTNLPPGNQAVAARRTPLGRFVVLTSAGMVLLLDNAGKETGRFPAGAGVVGNGLDVTPEGRVLLTDAGAGRVLEYDAAGKLRREWKVSGAVSATRLPNGNTLVACGGTEKVVEIDERGTVVWEHATKGSSVLRASKR